MTLVPQGRETAGEFQSRAYLQATEVVGKPQSQKNWWTGEEGRRGKRKGGEGKRGERRTEKNKKAKPLP